MLVGIYHAHFPAEYSCLFILFRLLCLGWPFYKLEVCGSSLLWRLLPVSVVELMVYQGFLAGEACIDVLVGGAGSSLCSAMKCPVVSFEVSMGLV